ncbi:MAG: hypothetical protein ACPHCN_09345 [Mycobacterium sp.]
MGENDATPVTPKRTVSPSKTQEIAGIKEEIAELRTQSGVQQLPPQESTESLALRLSHRNEFCAMLIKPAVLYPLLVVVVVISIVIAGVATGTYTFSEAAQFVTHLGGLIPKGS